MGLEPTPSGVTGRRYNQLNYDPACSLYLNPSHLVYGRLYLILLVGGTGLEPVTSTV